MYRKRNYAEYRKNKSSSTEKYTKRGKVAQKELDSKVQLRNKRVKKNPSEDESEDYEEEQSITSGDERLSEDEGYMRRRSGRSGSSSRGAAMK